MEREVIPHRRSSYFTGGGGGCISSPSCFPVCEENGYSRIHCSNSSSSNNNSLASSVNRAGRRWRNLLRRLVKDGKSSIYGSKPLSFHYDAVSYSQNFDEGCHYQESTYCPKVLRDVRWDVVPE